MPVKRQRVEVACLHGWADDCFDRSSSDDRNLSRIHARALPQA